MVFEFFSFKAYAINNGEGVLLFGILIGNVRNFFGSTSKRFLSFFFILILQRFMCNAY